MTQQYVIHWFRQDLRLSDNPSLCEAAKQGHVIPIYILDEKNAGKDKMGQASKIWLHHALLDLNKHLNHHLSIYKGDPLPILKKLCQKYGITNIHWNRCYEPWRIRRDKQIKSTLEKSNIIVTSHNGSLLWEPWNIQKEDKSHYKVFTPFYKKGCLKAEAPRIPLKKPMQLKTRKDAEWSIRLL